jgi:hypothetical protein
MGVTTDVPAGGGIYAGHISGDVIGSGWPSIAVSTDLNASGTEMDLSGTSGVRLYIKGNKSTGTAVDFLIQLVTTNITDYSYWRYNYTPTGNWTYVEIPWSNFLAPSWGQGAGMQLTDILQHIKTIQFAIADTTGGTANNTGNNWYIDQIEIYTMAMPTNTQTATNTAIPTNSFTPTQTNTGTQATATYTATNTMSVTLTSTAMQQNTQTPVATETEVDKLEIVQETPVITYPNPVIDKNTGINVKFKLTKSANKFKMRIYTAAYRLVN